MVYVPIWLLLLLVVAPFLTYASAYHTGYNRAKATALAVISNTLDLIRGADENFYKEVAKHVTDENGGENAP